MIRALQVLQVLRVLRALRVLQAPPAEQALPTEQETLEERVLGVQGHRGQRAHRSRHPLRRLSRTLQSSLWIKYLGAVRGVQATRILHHLRHHTLDKTLRFRTRQALKRQGCK